MNLSRANKYKLVFIGSAGGAVLNKLLDHHLVREMTHEVVSDRQCGFLSVAAAHSVPGHLAKSQGIEDGFSGFLKTRYENNQNILFISFYTKLFKGVFVKKNIGRIFNCHPSILPAFKGLNGFEDTLESRARFMGCTLHLVTEEMDAGLPVIQAALPVNATLPYEDNRHMIFLAQYFTTMQFIRWIDKGSFKPGDENNFELIDSRFLPSIFSPNLDDDFYEFLGEKNPFINFK